MPKSSIGEIFRCFSAAWLAVGAIPQLFRIATVRGESHRAGNDDGPTAWVEPLSHVKSAIDYAAPAAS